MELDIITKDRLNDFVNGDLFRRLSVLPISSLRANYLLNNDNIDGSDTLIVLVREGAETLSFAAFLPDRTKWGQKFAWNSGWWVNPEKGKAYALLPLIKGIDLWHEKVAFADLPPHSANILKKLNRFSFLPLTNGVKLILRPYIKSSSKMPLHLKMLDIFGKLAAPLGYVNLKKTSFNLELTKPLNIDWILEATIQPSVGITQRNGSDFEQIVRYPWLASSNMDTDQEAKKYPFSLMANNFDILFYKLIHNGASVGTVVLKIRDGHLQIPYLLTATNHIPQAMVTIVRFAIKQKLKSITLFRPDLLNALAHAAPLLSLRKTIPIQTAFGHEMVIEHPTKLMLHDGEGDCIFT
jgi:hypothetical protein